MRPAVPRGSGRAPRLASARRRRPVLFSGTPAGTAGKPKAATAAGPCACKSWPSCPSQLPRACTCSCALPVMPRTFSPRAAASTTAPRSSPSLPSSAVPSSWLHFQSVAPMACTCSWALPPMACTCSWALPPSSSAFACTCASSRCTPLCVCSTSLADSVRAVSTAIAESRLNAWSATVAWLWTSSALRVRASCTTLSTWDAARAARSTQPGMRRRPSSSRKALQKLRQLRWSKWYSFPRHSGAIRTSSAWTSSLLSEVFPMCTVAR
mmetsp:Transcript_50131/g.139235  ORF Transcript_50131/g.139235 Transcript_50131/m.139235 type:complete len:267 (+) Transcript_50131:83-883(+)